MTHLVIVELIIAGVSHLYMWPAIAYDCLKKNTYATLYRTL